VTRILHVINLGTTCGGAERLLAGTVAAQRAAGHEVQVLSSDLPGGGGTRFSDVEWPQSARSPHWFARLIGQLRNPDARAVLTKVLGHFRPEVVHLHTVGLLAPASLPVLADTPTVLTVHGPEIYVRATGRACLAAGYFRQIAGNRTALTLRGRLVLLATGLLAGRRWRRELRVVDVRLAPSRYLADLVTRDLGPTRVVPNGTAALLTRTHHPAAGPSVAADTPETAALLTHTHRPRVVFAGRLEHFKGPQVILEALPAVLAEHPDVLVSICGSGPMEPELRELIRAHDLGGNVELTGWLDPEALQRRVAAADVVLVPSIWPESFGLSCLEAFAEGVPVIATDLGGIPDLVRPGVCGLLVPPGDAAALARAIAELLSDEPRRRELGRAARAVHAEYTLDRHVSEVDSAYRDAMDAPRREPGRLARLVAEGKEMMGDSLLRNSALLLLSTLVLAGGGFLFWRVVTHLLTAEEVGRAGALISASTLVVNLSLLGLNNSLIRYLNEWPDRARTVNTAMTVVAIAALAGAVFFVTVLPALAPGLVGVRHPGQSLAFVALSVTGAIGLCFDNVFVALRRSGYVLGRNVLVVVLRLALPLLLLGSTAFDIFTAYWLALAIALPLYVTAARRLGLGAKLALGVERLRAMWRYSAANYMATAILMTPSLLMPVMVAQRVGPREAAEYYIASLLASVLVFVPQATARSFFAEVSHDGNRLREHLKRVVVVTMALQLPVLALLVLAGRSLLRVFGDDYVDAYPLLVLLALTSALSAVGFIGSTLLLATGRTRLLCQLSAAAYAVSLTGAYLLAGEGLVWIGAALLGGEILLAAGYLRVIVRALRAGPGTVPHQSPHRPEKRTLVS
jgi:glycosyltransferase involved in cell wall biosynthesis/O-antigen/teichoic acid export membrane protein